MSEANHCDEGGWLVSDPIPVPDDPTDYWVRGCGAAVGCNRLRCWNCGEGVRSAGGVAVADLEGRAQELHDAPDWSVLPGAVRGARVRTYACACTARVEVALHLTSPEDPDPSYDLDLPWRCAGHPPPGLPLMVDGLLVEADADLAQLVSRVAAGWVPGEAQRHYRELPAEWLCRLYARLAGLPLADRLARAIAVRMCGGEELERGAGLLFFDRFPAAPGHREVLELGERDGGRGMLEPSRVKYGEKFLLFSPLRVLRARLRAAADPGSPETTGLILGACKGALLAGPGEEDPANLDVLAERDGDWLAVHAAEIVRAHPARLRGLLERLRLHPREELLAIGGVALVSAEDADVGAIRRWLEQQGNLPLPALAVIRQALARRPGTA